MHAHGRLDDRCTDNSFQLTGFKPLVFKLAKTRLVPAPHDGNVRSTACCTPVWCCGEDEFPAGDPKIWQLTNFKATAPSRELTLKRYLLIVRSDGMYSAFKL